MAVCRLIYLEECGHSSHLERPEQTAAIILEALGIAEATSEASSAAVAA